MWYVLLLIVVFACLSKYSRYAEGREHFTNGTHHVSATALEPLSYVQKDYVGLKEPLNSREACPTYYEDINYQILRGERSTTETEYAYTPNRYLDITRFVDYDKLKEPLPVNPDFFMNLK